MALDAGFENFVDRARPPVFRKNLNLAITCETLGFDHFADRRNCNDAVAHHAPVVEQVLRRNEPVANVEGMETRSAGALNAGRKLRVPPDVIGIEGYPEGARALR